MIEFIVARSKVIKENHALFFLVFKKEFTGFSRNTGLVLKIINPNKLILFGGLWQYKRLTKKLISKYLKKYITMFSYVNNLDEGYDHIIPIQTISIDPGYLEFPIHWKHMVIDMPGTGEDDTDLLDLVYIECLLKNKGATI